MVTTIKRKKKNTIYKGLHKMKKNNNNKAGKVAQFAYSCTDTSK